MNIIPLSTGYVVTDGSTAARTFDVRNYASRRHCLVSAVTFAHSADHLEDEAIDQTFVKYCVVEL
jgi:hypothetical protein